MIGAVWPIWVEAVASGSTWPIPSGIARDQPHRRHIGPNVPGRDLGIASMWMHDAGQLLGEKRPLRSVPWRPEWQRTTSEDVRQGPAGTGAVQDHPTATVPREPGAVTTAPVAPPVPATSMFRARLRAARPHHHA